MNPRLFILSVVTREMLSCISLELCLFEERHIAVIAEGWTQLDGSRRLKPLSHGTMIIRIIYHNKFKTKVNVWTQLTICSTN